MTNSDESQRSPARFSHTKVILKPPPPCVSGPPQAFSILPPANGDPPQHLAFPPAPRCSPNSRKISHPWSSECKIFFGSRLPALAGTMISPQPQRNEHCISEIRRHSGPNAVPASEILKIGRARVVVRSLRGWRPGGCGPGCASHFQRKW